MEIQTRPDWSLFLLILIPCALLFLMALTIVATVLISSRHSFAAWQKLKSALAVLVWVVPATAIVAWVGMRLHPQTVVVSGAPSVMSRPTPPQLAAQQREQLIIDGIADQKTFDRELVNRQRPVVAEVEKPAPQQPPSDQAPATQIAPGEVAGATSLPRLKVRQISSDDPKWSTAANIVNGRELVALSSQRFATLAEAEENVTTMALQRIREYWSGETLLDFSGSQIRWPQSLRGEDVRQAVVELVDRFAVKDLVGEVMDWDFKNGTTGKMYRAHLRLDFTPQLHDSLQEMGRAVIVEGRVLHLGGLLGLVTLMLGTAAGYFKLDDATAGAYRRRLKLAAAAVIAAGGLAATRVLGS